MSRHGRELSVRAVESQPDGQSIDGTVQISHDTLHKVLLVMGKCIGLVGLFYVFVCSLDLLGSAFQLMCGQMAGQMFSSSVFLQNPVSALMIGVFGTVILQSSSTSTSIIVTMVASCLINVQQAIPIIMGANIGTSVTNTIVSVGHIHNNAEFKQAFAGATVHDMFNWLTVLVLLPLEVTTGVLYHISKAMVASVEVQSSGKHDRDILKVLTKPLTKLIVEVDKNAIQSFAANSSSGCHIEVSNTTVIDNSHTGVPELTTEDLSITQSSEQVAATSIPRVLKMCVGSGGTITSDNCKFLLAHFGLSDVKTGAILLVASIIILCGCLIFIVKILSSLLKGNIKDLIRKVTSHSDHSDSKCSTQGLLEYVRGYLFLAIGAGLTVIVQSSSVFTSTITPLVGIGAIDLTTMYSLTLGSNLGTTMTGIFASLAAPRYALSNALQIALVHLLFNFSGVMLFYVIPCTRFPISMAMGLGEVTFKYRWFPFLYIAIAFFFGPLIVFGFSFAGKIPFIIFTCLFLIPVGFLVILKIVQYVDTFKTCLPTKWRKAGVVDGVDMIVGSIKKCCKFSLCYCTTEIESENCKIEGASVELMPCMASIPKECEKENCALLHTKNGPQMQDVDSND